MQYKAELFLGFAPRSIGSALVLIDQALGNLPGPEVLRTPIRGCLENRLTG
jgi:hypothetical protein